jgi:hypothetical protein
MTSGRSRRGDQAGSVVMALFLLASLAMGGWIAAPFLANDRGVVLAIELLIGGMMAGALGPMLWVNWRIARDAWSERACVHASLSGRSMHIQRANGVRESFDLDGATPLHSSDSVAVEFKDGRSLKLPRSVRFRFALACTRDQRDPAAPDRDARELKLTLIRCWLYLVVGGAALAIFIKVARDQGWVPPGDPEPWKIILGTGVLIPSIMAAIWFASLIAERGWGFWRKKLRRA